MENKSKENTITQGYNDCFTLGTKQKGGGKVAIYIDHNYEMNKIWGKVDGENRCYYKMTYEKAVEELKRYLDNNWIFTSGTHLPEESSVRVSLYLDNAKFDNLHIFVIDFDEFDKTSRFFQAANELADKVTRSQGGGYHMFYGVDEGKATPLFDSIKMCIRDRSCPIA